MKRTNNRLISVKVGKSILLIMCILLFSLPVFGDYEISWSTIDNGGGASTGGTYSLVGTIGQADAGEMSGGDYELTGGFWSGGPILSCFVDFEHFALFSMFWLDGPCNAGNNFCGGADLDYSGDVTITDLNEVVYFWLDYCPVDWPLK